MEKTPRHRMVEKSAALCTKKNPPGNAGNTSPSNQGLTGFPLPDAVYEALGARLIAAAGAITELSEGLGRHTVSVTPGQLARIRTVIANFEANHPPHPGKNYARIDLNDARSVEEGYTYDPLFQLRQAVGQSNDLSPVVRGIILHEPDVRATMPREKERDGCTNVPQELAGHRFQQKVVIYKSQNEYVVECCHRSPKYPTAIGPL